MMLTNSMWENNVVVEAFKLSPKKLQSIGYPRNDVLSSQIKDSEIHSPELPQMQSGAKPAHCILYCPTFRPSEGTDGYSPLDIRKLDAFLTKHEAVLFLQLHPKYLREKLGEVVSQRIIFLEGGKDIYPQLKNIDICISDYSSLPYDFLLLDRPIIYYQYDYDTYVKSLGLQDEPEKITPGKQVHTFDELLETLEEIIKGNDEYKEKREQVRKLIFSHRDGNASERLFNLILNEINDSPPS